jgi:hypothetical protein
MLKKAISYVYSLVLISRALTFTVSALPVPHNCSAQQQEVHHIVPLSILIVRTTEKPTIIFFFISISSTYQPFFAIAFLRFFAFLTGTFPFAVNTKF